MSTPILGNLHIVLAGFLFKIFFNSPSTTPRYTIYCTGVRFWNHPVLNPSCFLLFGLHLCVSILPFSHFWHGASRIKKTPDSNHLGAIIPTIGRIPNNKPQIGNGFLLILWGCHKNVVIAIPGRNSQSIYLWIKKRSPCIGASHKSQVL